MRDQRNKCIICGKVQTSKKIQVDLENHRISKKSCQGETSEIKRSGMGNKIYIESQTVVPPPGAGHQGCGKSLVRCVSPESGKPGGSGVSWGTCFSWPHLAHLEESGLLLGNRLSYISGAKRQNNVVYFPSQSVGGFSRGIHSRIHLVKIGFPWLKAIPPQILGKPFPRKRLPSNPKKYCPQPWEQG